MLDAFSLNMWSSFCATPLFFLYLSLIEYYMSLLKIRSREFVEFHFSIVNLYITVVNLHSTAAEVHFGEQKLHRKVFKKLIMYYSCQRKFATFSFLTWSRALNVNFVELLVAYLVLRDRRDEHCTNFS